jgi:hypothetical protein
MKWNIYILEGFFKTATGKVAVLAVGGLCAAVGPKMYVL